MRPASSSTAVSAPEWGGSPVPAPKRKGRRQSPPWLRGGFDGSRDPWMVILTAQLLRVCRVGKQSVQAAQELKRRWCEGGRREGSFSL
jgi:hypothetical protein